MPKAQSVASFPVAAKHLFRHLHEPHRLRQNPLVAHLFKGAINGLARAREERAVVRRVHQLVRDGADHCRDRDLVTGKGDRAVRQHAIIMLQCLEQRPVRDVAATLGISYYHCYRERASICRRVAQYVSEYSRAKLEYLPELDEFGLLLNYTRYRASFGDEEVVRRAMDELIGVAPSPHQAVEALRIGAMRMMEFGGIASAEKAHAAACRVVSEQLTDAASDVQALAQASLDLFGSELAHRRGENQEAVNLGEHAKCMLERAATLGTVPYVREMYVESVLELGAMLWSLGITETSYRCVSDAERHLEVLDSTSLPLKARIRASLWKLRNYLLLDAKGWYPARERLEGLSTAFQEAYSSGSLGQAIDIAILLTEHHAFTGSDDEALRFGRFALLLVKQSSSESLRVQTFVDVGARLLRTRHWEFAASLLTNCKDRGLDAYHRELLDYFKAERLLRFGLFNDALVLATKESNYGHFVTLTVRAQVIAAAAAHALSRRSKARSLIEGGVAAAERLSSAPILRDAYRVAAVITGEERFKRQEREITRVLVA